ncbi:MAG TPA: MarR family transcriptional regulator [Dehalococcoidia bacterium]|nr:MarR family transcriptional regulator [Dehalococcoidia bacterium]
MGLERESAVECSEAVRLYSGQNTFVKGKYFRRGKKLEAPASVEDLPARTVELGRELGIAEERVERLVRVAVAYGDAVGIIDVLRIEGWSEDGLTIPQMRLLWALRDEDGLPVGALAERLGVNPSTITGHVDRLVRQGLVRREEDPTDRRIVRNYLTEEGAVTVGAMRHFVGAYLINILKRLSDEKLERLEQALADLNHAAVEARHAAT